MRNLPILGVVEDVSGPLEGPSAERSYTIRWTLPTGGEFVQVGCQSRQIKPDDPIERIAFPIGFPILGLLLSGGTDPMILVTDREDYAVGCEGGAA